MLESLHTSKRLRKNFGQINSVATIPSLIEIQKQSYNNHFLQLNIADNQRKNIGLQNVLNSIFPIRDSSNRKNRI